MNEAEHIERHKKLHAALDELVADWIDQTRNEGVLRSISSLSVMELIEWSFRQTKNPTDL